MNNKIKYITIFGGNTHAHHPNCNDCNMPKYAMSLKYAKDIELVKSPFADYTDIEFTNLMLATGVKPNGCSSEIELNNCDVEMIGPNQYIFVDWNGRDIENEDYYSHDDNGNRIVYDLATLKKMCGFNEWEEIKVFPCVKKVTI